jgi:NifU-like protein involved in Fe-S cluster formation
VTSAPSGDPYSKRVRELFANPAHAGDIEGAIAVLVENQGVRVALAASREQDLIVALRFRAWGCPHLIAAAEAFCAGYEGQPWSSLEDFRTHELMQSLPVPAQKMGRILVLEDAARSLGQSDPQRPIEDKD